MATGASLRAWSAVHRWTSLACTIFLLLLCTTGLPLIFHEEIEHLAGAHPDAPAVAPGTPRASLDRVLAAAQAHRPDKVAQFVAADAEDDRLWFVTFGDAPRDAVAQETIAIDARTTEPLALPRPDEGFMHLMLKLHTDLFAGLPGTLFLGFMGLLLLLAIVSGVVLYGPFMRKLRFGTVRRGHAPRTRWLDLHNLLGIVTLVWAAVVGATGVINTLGVPLVELWRIDQLADMVGPDKGEKPAAPRASLQAAVDAARTLRPGMAPSLIALPGTAYTSSRHYGIFLRGETPLTARLLAPVFVDAQSGGSASTRDLPWYIQALLLSQPLHFGDYGGMPFKVLWALLDLATIVVLASGLVLWLQRRERTAPAPRNAVAAGTEAGLVPTRAEARRSSQGSWTWPLAIGAATGAGLGAALLADGAWDLLPTAVLAIPVVVTIGCIARGPRGGVERRTAVRRQD